jgi:geranylgeranyl diphosphate synthase type II
VDASEQLANGQVTNERVADAQVTDAQLGECLRDLIEGRCLRGADPVEGHDSPPGLTRAVHHAVFPGGARIRPKICLAVAQACLGEVPPAAVPAAAAIELLHCASLVHDDLPCFDDSPLRRGRGSVHHVFGERLAVLAGDALIVLAFEAVGQIAEHAPERMPSVMAILLRSVGMHHGIIAGQAWECEEQVDRPRYQRLKTGSLFAAATAAGAAVAGADTRSWWALGERIGSAYQVFDDIQDAAGDSKSIGKPIGQDAAHGHPNAAEELGLDDARRHFRSLLAQIAEAIPPCAGRKRLEAMIFSETDELLPRAMTDYAA